MRGRRGIALAVIAFGLAIGSAHAQDSAADPALQQQYDRLFQQMLEQPANLDAMFAFSDVATRLGRYEPAITTLERMLIYNPNLPRVRLELGVLYLRIGAPQVARSYFSEALQAPDVPEPVRARAQAFIDQIEDQTSPNQFAGSVFGGLRYQTNANAGPGSGRVLVQGIEATLQDRFRRQDDVNAFLSGVLVHRYDLGTPRSEFLETRAIAYASKQFDQENLDLGVIQIDTGPQLAFLPDLIPTTTIRPYVLGNLVSLDEKLLFGSVGGGAQIRHQVNDRLLLETEGTLSYREFDNSSTFPTVDNQSGVEAGVALRANYRLAPDLVLRGEASYSNLNARMDFESYDEYGVAASLEYTYGNPFGLDVPPWTVAIAAGYIFRDYEEPDPTISPGQTRHDEELRLSLLNSFRISRSWSVEAQLQYIDNNSNIPNFERDNFIVLVGALFSF